MPVFCSDIPVLREVGGQDVNYFDPWGNPHEVAEMMLSVLGKPGPSRHRRAVLGTYSWNHIINSRMLPFFERLLAEGSGANRDLSTNRNGVHANSESRKRGRSPEELIG